MTLEERAEIVDLILRISTDISICRKPHTYGAICSWGAYKKHVDYCDETNCSWLQATARVQGKEY